MKALQFRQYGGRDVLELNANVPRPAPAKGQVLVQVQAASINPVDWKIRLGYLKEYIPLTMPATLGVDFTGLIVDTAGSDSGLKLGDRVYGYASPLTGGSGSFAEFATVPISNVARAPQKGNAHEAAALPLAGASALQALEEHLKLQRGQKILIHGGGGGIGSLAIQIAKVIGASVATTAAGEDLTYVRSLGADVVIDYRTEAFESKVKSVDAVFDTVGGLTTTKSFQVLRPGGCLVSMHGQPDQTMATQYGITVMGQLTHVTTDVLSRLRELVEGGHVNIRIAKVFPLSRSKEAFELAEEGHPKGKVVFDVLAD
ncbi:MAG TPA: NADP-dependent oxidoreductase [Nitrospiraceae bacterium]|nr:NADP-dependent oxidoreductase [Nitrospiraceae bacterium]